MDNLTHSLIGALIGQAGLKRKTGLAMPALIIGANIPDIDATCVLLGNMQHLALRRGITHGPIAWVVLPLILAGALHAFDRWQAKRGRRPAGRAPVRFGWLYLLSLMACLTHPFFDWLNSYGIRLLAPFSHRWFYGDTLFIIDLWLWLGLGVATWFSLRRERSGGEWRRPARMAIVGALAYIGVNWVISQPGLQSDFAPAVQIESPVPVAFWKRERIVGEGDGFWVVDGRRVGDLPLKDCHLASERRQRRDVDAFLFWSRAPLIDRREDGSYVLGDARYYNPLSVGRFSIVLSDGTCAVGSGVAGQ